MNFLLPAPILETLPPCAFAIFVHNIACLTGVIRGGKREKWGTLSVIIYLNFSCPPHHPKLQQPRSQGLPHPEKKIGPPTWAGNPRLLKPVTTQNFIKNLTPV